MWTSNLIERERQWKHKIVNYKPIEKCVKGGQLLELKALQIEMTPSSLKLFSSSRRIKMCYFNQKWNGALQNSKIVWSRICLFSKLQKWEKPFHLSIHIYLFSKTRIWKVISRNFIKRIQKTEIKVCQCGVFCQNTEYAFWEFIPNTIATFEQKQNSGLKRKKRLKNQVFSSFTQVKLLKRGILFQRFKKAFSSLCRNPTCFFFHRKKKCVSKWN